MLKTEIDRIFSRNREFEKKMHNMLKNIRSDKILPIIKSLVLIYPQIQIESETNIKSDSEDFDDDEDDDSEYTNNLGKRTKNPNTINDNGRDIGTKRIFVKNESKLQNEYNL